MRVIPPEDCVAYSQASTMDRHVGLRVKERRTMLGVSQQELAGMIGVTYQQEQKYEGGQNRISAGRLFGIAAALSAPITWFFKGNPSPAPKKAEREPMSVGLARDFAAIDTRHQKALSNLAHALAHPPKSKAD